MYDTKTIPLSTATPKRLMNPTEAGTLRYSPVSQSATTPPISANGRFSSTMAVSAREPKVR